MSYVSMSPMRWRYYVRSLQKSNVSNNVCYILFRVIYLLESDTQVACDTEGTSMLVQLGPDHEIYLGGAPYELVPGYFVNSLLVLMTHVISEGSGENVCLRSLARVSLCSLT